MSCRWFRQICSLEDGRRGAVAVLAALALIAIIGFVALGTEIVMLLLVSRQMQSAADAAAMAGMTARLRGYPTDYSGEARALAAAIGFVDGQGGTTVSVSYLGSSDAVEVVIAQPQALALAETIYPGSFTVRARAVAHAKADSGACILALDPTAAGAVSMNGATTANLVGCNLMVNSSSASAVSLVGGATLSADYIYTRGGYTTGGGSRLNATMIQTQAPATPDPYADIAVPGSSVCLQNNYKPAASTTLSPGTYCNGISVGAGVTLTLNPGVYIVTKKPLSLTGGASLVGTGVTIVLTGSGANYSSVSISGGAILNLTAPTSGATAGLLFFQDPNAPACTSATCNNFNGGADQRLTGILYFPNQSVQYGGSTTTSNNCTEIVALQVALIGNQNMQVACAGTGVTPIGGQAELIE